MKKNLLILKSFVFILSVMLISSIGNAQRIASASGPWENTATWGGSAPPTSAQTATINNGIAVTINSADVCLSLSLTGGSSSTSVTISGTNSLHVSGNATILAGTTTQVIAVGAGTLQIDGSLTLNSGLSSRVSQLTINTGTATVTGNLVLVNNGGGLTLTPITFSGAGTLNLGGSFTNGGSFTPGSGTVNYNAAGAQTVGTYAYNNLTLSNSGAKTVTGATVNGSLSMQGTATVTGSPTYGAASTLEYAGSSAQSSTSSEFPSAGGPFNLKINNASGVTLSAARSISGDLNLANGLLTTSSVNLLTINAGGTNSTGASTASFVNGPMAKTGTTAFTFPVGKSGAGFRTIAIGAPTVSSTFNAEFMRSDPHATSNTFQAPITQISACEYWVLNRTAGTGNASVTLSWGASSTCHGANYVTDLPSLRVARYNGTTQWNNEGNTATTGAAAAGTVTSGTVTSFSPFTLGTTSALNPLPVKLSNIKAYEKQQGIQIEWTAYQEENLSRYSIERSADGITFTSIGEVTSRNSAIETNYGFFDASPMAGVNFYRLRSIDMDGKFAYSSIVRVTLDKSVKDISLYPNPATGGFISFQGSNLAKGNYTVRVFNSAGVQLLNQNFSHTGGAISQTIKLPGGTPSGMYSLQLINDGAKLMSKSFMVQ